MNPLCVISCDIILATALLAELEAVGRGWRAWSIDGGIAVGFDRWSNLTVTQRVAVFRDLAERVDRLNPAQETALQWSESGTKLSAEDLRRACTRWRATEEPPVAALVAFEQDLGPPIIIRSWGLASIAGFELQVTVTDAARESEGLRNYLRLIRHALQGGEISAEQAYVGVAGAFRLDIDIGYRIDLIKD